MWFDSKPRYTGWYLCAWIMGDGYIYDVGKWDGKEWITSMTADPRLWQEIQSPDKQWEMLDELYDLYKDAQ